MTSLHSDLTGPTNLHEAFHYVQTSDPGAVGAGKYWLDTTGGSPFTLKRRNAGDTNWDVIGASAAGNGLGWINVAADFSAVPDDATDNTTALNNAIAAIIAQGGGTLYFPITGDGNKYQHNSDLSALQTEAARVPIHILFDMGVQLRPSADVLSFNMKQDDSQDFSDIVNTVVFENVWVDAVTPGQATGCRIRDSFGIQFKSCFFTNLKKGVLVESFNSWSEGTMIKGCIFDGNTTGIEFLKTTGQTPAATGSNQSSRIEAFIRTASGGTGIKVGAGATVYGSSLDLNIWPVGNNAIGIDMQGDGNHSIWHGLVDLAGQSGLTGTLALQIGSAAAEIDSWQFDMEFAGDYSGGGGNEEGGAVDNPSSVTWVHGTMPYGTGGGGGGGFGTITSFTPTWSADGSAPSLGNGTLTGRYAISADGKLVWVMVELVAGSTTTFGTGEWRFAKPTGTVAYRAPMTAWAYDSSAPAEYQCGAQIGFGDSGFGCYYGGLGVRSDTPFTWATGDHFGFSGIYPIS